MTVHPLRAAAAAWRRRTYRHVELHPFRGYGTPTRLLLRGRVLRSTGLIRSRLGDSVVDNLRNVFHRFESDEVPGALVAARAGGAEARVWTDGEGYFDVALELPEPLKGGERHKLAAIRALLDTYPDLGVVLVGDCGERDPEIYRQVVLRHLGRVLAVYVRDVAPERHDAVRAIADELAGHGVDLVFSPDTEAARRHALDHGLIVAAALAND